MAIENKKILTDKFSYLTDISDQSNSIVLATLSSQLSFWGTLSEVQIGILKCYAPIALDQSNNTQDMIISLRRTHNYLNSHYSMIFLYNLSRLICVSEPPTSARNQLCDKLYLLNRMCNGLDLYYGFVMPEHFLIGHGLGTVFSRAEYGEYLVVYQNVTIGVQKGEYPKIGERVIIYGNCFIAGRCVIGANCVIGAGTKLINKTIAPNTIVYEKNGILQTKENCNQEILNYFELSNCSYPT